MFRLSLTLFLVLLCLAGWAKPLDPEPLDRLIQRAVAQGDTAGAVLLVGQGREVLYHKAFGWRISEGDRREKMGPDTVFDLASLTKPIATATAVMWLIQQRRLHPETRLVEHLPEVDPRLTVHDLLLHTGGLPPGLDLEGLSPEEAWHRILKCEVSEENLGQVFRYSDVSYLMLGRLVEAVDGRSLDRLCAEEFWVPLGMEQTSFAPTKRGDIAATYQREPGQVHDPKAFQLGGVAGHAGLFSNASDLARFAQGLLGYGTFPIEPEFKDMMLARRGRRTYGFDVDSPYAGARGERFGTEFTFGHTGFTGTSIWLDREHGLYVILLTNRLHPDNEGSVLPLRSALATNVANQLLGPPVETGIDRLTAERFAPLRGHRVGLITNHTGLDKQGRRTIDLFHQAQGVELVRLFSPEHGIEGVKDSAVGDSLDQATGLPIDSLYGESRRPRPESLQDLDTLVFDIQDVGCRFYTYSATMLYAMRAAKEQGLRFVVLDRPNPLGGELVDGPLASSSQLDFIACWPMPLVHGLTVGELARLYNREVGVELDVIPMKGWKRSMNWEDTGLTWYPPSPNLRNLKQAYLYPAVGLLEWAELSVGRGTDEPFERFGAPWIDNERTLAWELNQLALPGVAFVPIRFVPRDSVFKGQECGGVHLVLRDKEAFRPALCGLRIAAYLARTYPERFTVGKIGRHLANDAILHELQEVDEAELASSRESFELQREGVLLYK